MASGPAGGLFNVSEQAQRIAGQRFAFFGRGDFDTAEIAVAVFTERLHIEAVVVAQIPLVLLSKKDQRAAALEPFGFRRQPSGPAGARSSDRRRT